MSQIINSLNSFSEKWANIVFHIGWQAGLVGLVILGIIFYGKKWSSAWKYALLMIALLKFVSPPFLFVPVGLFSQIQLEQSDSQNDLLSDKSTPQQRIAINSDFNSMKENKFNQIIQDKSISATVEQLPESPLAETSTKIITQKIESSDPSLNISSSLMLVWLAGFTLSSFWLLKLKIKLIQLTRQSELLNNTDLNRNLKQFCSEMNVKNVPQILVSSEISVPFTTGIVSPKIFLPRDAYQTLNEEQLNVVLVHELAHQKRWDLWVNSLQNIAFTLWWFHPVYWMLNRTVQSVREECCDDYIISHNFSSQEIYCETLLHVARNSASRAMPRQLVSMAHSKTSLMFRITRLMENKMSYAFTPRNLSVIILLAIILIPGLNADQKENESEPNSKTSSSANSQDEISIIKGIITDSKGQPISGADVAVIGDKKKNQKGGDYSSRDVVVAEAKTNEKGNYQLSLKNFLPSDFHRFKLIALSSGHAMSWKDFSLEDGGTVENIQLAKEKEIQLQLVDKNKKPVQGVNVSITFMKFAKTKNRSANKSGRFQTDFPPAAWPTISKSDANGMIKIHGTGFNHAIYIKVAASNKIAPQFIFLNVEKPKGKVNTHDGYHRFNHIDSSKKIVVPLIPPQFINAVVLSEKTNQPIPNVRFTIFSGSKGQHAGHGLEEPTRTDAKGHIRLNPYLGFEFRVNIYPEKGTPYLASGEEFNWDDVKDKKEMVFKLSKGVLINGTVTDNLTGKPISNAYVQYHPESETNSHYNDKTQSGSDTAQLSDSKGEFQIAVLPGPGRILVHAPDRKYIYKVVSGAELYRGKKGGKRNYAHAVEKINPSEKSSKLDLSISLTKGKTVKGHVLTPSGKPVKKAQIISNLYVQPLNGYWRGFMNIPVLGGDFELTGCDPEKTLTVYFLDPVNKLGATVKIKKGFDYSKPLTVHLEPCGKMKARILKPDGSPQKIKDHFNFSLFMRVTPGAFMNDRAAMERGELFADSDLLANIDRLNFWHGPGTDEKGHIIFNPLIPGAVYQFTNMKDDRLVVDKEFTVKSGETLDLGDITMKLHE